MLVFLIKYTVEQDKKQERTELINMHLVPIPCPLVPISAIRDWNPSGLNH